MTQKWVVVPSTTSSPGIPIHFSWDGNTATADQYLGKKIMLLLSIVLSFYGNDVMYSEDSAYHQVQLDAINNIMLPSLSWINAIAMPHHLRRVRVRRRVTLAEVQYPVPLPEGGNRHYAACCYPHQCECGCPYRLCPPSYRIHVCRKETEPQS